MVNTTHQTESFLRLLSSAVLVRRIIGHTDLERLQESAAPYNPLDQSTIESSPEMRFAYKAAFDKLLICPGSLHWDLVSIAAAGLLEQITKQQNASVDAAQETRWLPLSKSNRLFDITLWTSAWSRRNLEIVIGFFSSNARYLDATLGYAARGRSDIRRLFARLMHAPSWTWSSHLSEFYVDARSATLRVHWERSYSVGDETATERAPKHLVGGAAELMVERGKIVHCEDTWNADEAMLRTLGTASPSDRIQLLKVFKFRKSVMPSGCDTGND